MSEFVTIKNARQRAIMARRFPCVCRGKGCSECAFKGHLTDRRSYAQLVDNRPSTLPPPDDQLPF